MAGRRGCRIGASTPGLPRLRATRTMRRATASPERTPGRTSHADRSSGRAFGPMIASRRHTTPCRPYEDASPNHSRRRDRRRFAPPFTADEHRADVADVLLRAGRRSSRCLSTCVPTSPETPIERGSVTRCDGQGVNRGSGSGSRASTGGGLGAPLPRVRGPLDQADRRPSRPLSGNSQGILLMRREAPCCIPGAAGRDSEEGPWV